MIERINVWKINSDFVVASSMEEAIEIFKEKYEFPYNEITNLRLICNSALIKK